MGVVAIIGLIVIVVGFGYGIWRSRTRDRRLDPQRDAATLATYTDDGPPRAEPSKDADA